MKKLLSIMFAAMMALSLFAGLTTAVAEEPVRVAVLLSGPISDMSWNYTAYLGLKKIEALGAEVAYQESVDVSILPDCINTYATDGYDVIFLSTNSYQDVAMEVAPDYPDTQFIIINGKITEGNICSYEIADEDQGFLMGALDALMSKNHKVGFVGAMEITPILNGRAGFEQGAKYADPDVEVVAVMTGSFSDVNAAKETSKAMIDGGVDAISPMCDSAALGVDQAAEEGGIVVVTSGEGQETTAPNSDIVAVIKDTSMVYEAAYKEYLDGSIGTKGVVKLGAAQGTVYYGEWYAAGIEVPEEVKTRIMEIYDDLCTGKVQIVLG